MSSTSTSLSAQRRRVEEKQERHKEIMAIYKNTDWNAEEKYRKVQQLMKEDEKQVVQQKEDRLRRKTIGSIYGDKSLTPQVQQKGDRL